MPDGFLALVLHAHLPYLRHPEGKEHLEERWLFEAVTECYLPLLKVLEGLVADGVDFRLTISLSPPLLAMFTDPLLMERYGKYLDALVELGEKEVRRTARLPEFHPLALYYLENFLEIKKAFYEDYGANVISGFKSLAASGKVELITTAATHGYLPLMSSAEARRAQVAAGLQFFSNSTGIRPPGFWLPECGYVPGLEEILGEQGLRYFFTEAHCVLHSRPRPRFGVYMPVFCGGGRRAVAAFARDPLSSRQVWDRHAGYPGDPAYREFYRDIGYDLDLDYLGPSLPGRIRVDTGFKYYRITGRGPLHEKEPYRPEEARARAAEHAADFVLRKKEQISRLKAEVPAPVVVAPYDAELFGHWWYEGPRWLDCLCRYAGDQKDFRMVTPSEYLAARTELQTVELSPGSWGEGGYHSVWLNEANDWLYRHLHRAEAKMSELADLAGEAAALEERALNQAAKELLLAQSSDWAFIIKAGTAVEYAKFRFINHLQNFNALAGQLERREIDEEFVFRIEQSGGAFPVPDYRLYSRRARVGLKKPFSGSSRRYRVMILSWEYPPVIVGGLSRHVHDLAHALTGLGDEVHVLTCPHKGQG
ncbi:MAG: DUF1957 domain-containing protein, partial [Firmicutes bacterium]|nr:DUF1957 domain-containing protein [Bacillota bacterium]